MKVVAIVVEFNPFHNGHKYIVEKAKEITKSEFVICIMSGNFTQAGNIAIYDKFYRADIAVKNGVDLVIELPTIYATSSSEFFSFGAVNIINSLGIVDYICFGSETGEITILDSIAKKIVYNENTIWENVSKELKSGVPFAKARETVLKDILNREEFNIFSTSNNILGIEYIKSLQKLNSNIIPYCIKRNENNTTISATKIREIIQNEKNIDKTLDFLPNGYSNDKTYTSNSDLYNILKYEIIRLGTEGLKNINEVTEGLENRIYEAINNSSNYEELIEYIKSKRYHMSKIKRIMISILLGITKEKFDRLYKANVSYAHVLSCTERGKRLLSYISKSIIPLITSINNSTIETLKPIIKESLELDILASNIYNSISNDNINRDYTNRL